MAGGAPPGIGAPPAGGGMPPQMPGAPGGGMPGGGMPGGMPGMMPPPAGMQGMATNPEQANGQLGPALGGLGNNAMLAALLMRMRGGQQGVQPQGANGPVPQSSAFPGGGAGGIAGLLGMGAPGNAMGGVGGAQMPSPAYLAQLQNYWNKQGS